MTPFALAQAFRSLSQARFFLRKSQTIVRQVLIFFLRSKRPRFHSFGTSRKYSPIYFNHSEISDPIYTYVSFDRIFPNHSTLMIQAFGNLRSN